MRVSELMSRQPVEVQRSESLDAAMMLMDEHDVRHLPVVDSSGLVGVISDRDLLDATGWLPRREREIMEAPEGTVGDFMHSPPICVEHDFKLEHALSLMVKRRIGSLPVMNGASLVGMLTEMDILRGYVDACRTGRIDAEDDSHAREHMSPAPMTVSRDAAGEEAIGLMRKHGLRHLPVVADDKQLVGILSDRDVRRYRGRGQIELMLVGEMMSGDPRTAEPDKGLSYAAHIMLTHRISALPVVAEEGLVGLLTLIDVMIPCALTLMKHE